MSESEIRAHILILNKMLHQVLIQFVYLFRWTINLALTTANQMFKSSNPFDSQDLVEVSFTIIEFLKH